MMNTGRSGALKVITLCHLSSCSFDSGGAILKKELEPHTKPFHAHDLFQHSLKTSENLFSDFFSGYKKGPVIWNG